MGSSERHTRSDLCFRKITLAIAWKSHGEGSDEGEGEQLVPSNPRQKQLWPGLEVVVMSQSKWGQEKLKA